MYSIHLFLLLGLFGRRKLSSPAPVCPYVYLYPILGNGMAHQFLSQLYYIKLSVNLHLVTPYQVIEYRSPCSLTARSFTLFRLGIFIFCIFHAITHQLFTVASPGYH